MAVPDCETGTIVDRLRPSSFSIEKTHMSNSLKSKRDRFVAFAFATSHLLLETTLDGVITYAAGASCGLAGSVQTLVGRNLAELAAPRDRSFAENIVQRVREKRNISLLRLVMLTASGSDITFLVGGCRLEEGEDTLHFGLILAPTFETGAANQGIRDMDEFTRAAQARMDISIRAGTDESLTLFVVDALVELASKMGSQAIRPVADEISAYLRSVSVGGDGVGDVKPGKFGLIRAAGITEAEIRENINRILARSNIAPKVTCFSLDFDTTGLSDTDAARALSYAVKRFADSTPGDYNIRTLRDGASVLVGETTKLLAKARQIMSSQQIDIVYQPIVRMDKSEVHHLEALSRISGVSSIGEFMKFVEDSGMSQEFDLMLASMVMENVAEFARTGWKPTVAINMSAKSLQSPLFVDQFNALVGSHKGMADSIMLEMTETADVQDFQKMAQVLDSLRKRGHKICLDDVGAGTTSLQTLSTLQADYVKIDGSLVRSAENNPRDRALLKAVVDWARQEGSEVIAEQIETKNQAKLMHALGCAYGQGYLFGRATSDCSLYRNSKMASQIIDPEWRAITSGKSHARVTH